MSSTKIDLKAIRSDFPATDQLIHGKPLIYLDTGASSLKCRPVIEAINQHYSKETANVHRGVHFLSEQGTIKYEETRKAVQNFINAPQADECLFTKGTTDSFNLLAHSYGEAFIKEDDVIIISEMEHHANIVPWQMMAKSKKAKVLGVKLDNNGDLDLEDYKRLLNDNAGKVKIVSLTLVSNTMGTVNPIKELCELAHRAGAHFACDAAQGIAHMNADVQELGVDFLAFSAHKMFGPTGVGILWGKRELLEKMPPYQGGGAMIDQVTIAETTYAGIPNRFEAGTPHIAGVIAFKAAIDYIQEIGRENISAYEDELLSYAKEKLSEIEGIRFIGNPKKQASVVSFLVGGAHPHDLGMLLDRQGIAVRTGHHCTQPIMQRYGISGTVRASFSIYNSKEDVDALCAAIVKSLDFL